MERGNDLLNRTASRLLGRLKAVDRAPHWNPRVTVFIVVVALVNAVLYHRPLYSFAVANLDFASLGGVLILATLDFLTTFVTALILALLSPVSQHLNRRFCMLAALCNALALYFVEAYGVVLDKSMMGNVFNTDFAEARSYLHPKLLAYLLLFGVWPCWFLSRVQIQKTSMLRRVGFLFSRAADRRGLDLCQRDYLAVDRPELPQGAGSPGLKHNGVEVGLAADGRGIAKLGSDTSDHCRNLVLEGAVRDLVGMRRARAHRRPLHIERAVVPEAPGSV